VALGAANLTGQASAAAAARVAAVPVAKATCSPAGTGNEAVVDLDSHRSFARLRTICVGTLHGAGVIHAGALFVLEDVGLTQDASTEIVRIDLNTYAVARSAPLGGGSWMFAGAGDIWVVTDSTDASLVELSPVSLRVAHRFAEPVGIVLPFAGRLWFIENYSLETLDPTNGRLRLYACRGFLLASVRPASHPLAESCTSSHRVSRAQRRRS